MNISQVRPHTPPSSKPHHKPVGWTFVSSFSMRRKYTQQRHLTTPGRADQLPGLGLWASNDTRFSLLGQCYKPPNGVTISKTVSKNVTSREALNCFLTTSAF